MWPSESAATRIYNSANIALIVALVLGVLATWLVVWMGKVKDEYISKNVAATEERAGAANERAGTAEKDAGIANERAAKLEVEALSLKKELIAQGSRANLLYGKTAEDLISELKPFGEQKVEIRYPGTAFNQSNIDNDTMGVAMRLEYLFGQAGWSTTPLLRANMNGVAIRVTVSSNAPKKTIDAAGSLINALRKVPLLVNQHLIVIDEPRPPQGKYFEADGREIEIRPLTADTIVVTVLSHP